MRRIETILVATDCSECARRAETRAAMLTFELKARILEIMAVQADAGARLADQDAWMEPQRMSQAADRDQEALTQQWTSVTLARSVRHGDPAAAVLTRAFELQADLTLVAARGREFFADLFLRDSTHALERGTARALLLVNREPQSAYRRILVATDFSEASEEAAAFAMGMAPAASFTFVHAHQLKDEGAMHVAGLPDSTINALRDHRCEAARSRLNAFIVRLGRTSSFVSRTVEAGHPVRIIGDTARRIGADLIVIGRSNKQQDKQPFSISVTQRLVAASDADLLVVPVAPNDDWFDLPAA